MSKAPKPDPAKPALRFGKGQPAHYCGKAGRSGAPAGNGNALRHGLRAGQLPKDARYIELRLNAFRRTLEQAVLDARGEVTIPDAAYIQTALRWERHGCLAQRWLNKKYQELKPADLLQFSREVARASAERDKALAALKIGAKPLEPWLALPAPSNGDEQ